ncbi:AGAP007263-PA-like protein [Anopheles sinensis]|uniref:AGAP007263-PA-like protein n=1 Tax=Anopheles sinensis TaxID=74873 RepID=A0A084VQU5_ANOSI|nr:AGAP007263-PA-like protein [Anopheles sinensis]
MYAFVVSVALACLAQVVHSSPDFGIQASVAGKDAVLEWALVAKTNFLRVDDYIMPAQKSDIGKLGDAAIILSGIALQVNNLGPALIDTITTATDDDSGDIAGAYAQINFARIMFEDYISNTLLVQIQSIEALLGFHIRDQLNDDFFHITARLVKLNETLVTLQKAVEDAQAAAGGGIVSNDLVKQFVTPDLVAQLARHLGLLAHRIPVLIYTLTSSLENIQQADDYFYGLMEDTTRVLDEIGQTASDFYNDAMAYSTEVETAMNNLIDNYEDDFTRATATAQTLNVADLTTAISGFSTVRDTKLDAKLQEYMALYQSKIDELSKLLPIETNFFFDTNEHPAGVLVDVLIANGPWSRFCFWKYSAVLHNLLLVSNYASECLDRELDRLQTLQEALLIEIELIEFDLEIIDPYSTACSFVPAGATSRTAECANALSSYFLTMSNAYDTKLAAFVKLAEIELKAAKERLSVCWMTRMQQSFVAFQNIVGDIVACGESGPLA